MSKNYSQKYGILKSKSNIILVCGFNLSIEN